MCLDKGFKEARHNTGIGWKVFKNIEWDDPDSGLMGTDRGDSRHLERPVNKWIHERNFRDTHYTGSPSEGYGFHIFRRKKDAVAFDFGVVKKVKYRKATMIGTLTSFLCNNTVMPNVVAKEIFIIDKG